jgi:hypothetical protein
MQISEEQNESELILINRQSEEASKNIMLATEKSYMQHISKTMRDSNLSIFEKKLLGFQKILKS